MSTYRLKHATVEAEQFTEAFAASLRATAEEGKSTEPYAINDHGGYSVYCGADKRLVFGDYVLLDGEGKPYDVVGRVEFNSRYEQASEPEPAAIESAPAEAPKARKAKEPPSA